MEQNKIDKKNFSMTRVVTKDAITDFFQSLRNFFGFRLRGYENLISKNISELIEEMELKYKNVNWWRLSINPLTDGSAMITIYGGYDD